MTTPTTPEVDEFAAAFADLNSPAPKAETPPADPPVETPLADTPPAETPPADPPVETPPADTPPAETPPADPPVETPPVDTPPAAETEEQMRARIRAELEAELKPKAAAPKADTSPADPPAAPAAPVKIYTEEEDKILEKYKNDWPDIAAAEQLARRADSYRVVEHIFIQLRPILNELQERVGAHSKRSMYDDLIDLVPDYDDVRDKTLEWIETQPDYLKTAYQQVANEGTPDQVADLINRFKRETGYQTAAHAAKPAAPAAPVTAPAVAPAVAKAAAALKPVTTTRSEPKTDVEDKNDFDSAFAEFSKV